MSPSAQRRANRRAHPARRDTGTIESDKLHIGEKHKNQHVSPSRSLNLRIAMKVTVNTHFDAHSVPLQRFRLEQDEATAGTVSAVNPQAPGRNSAGQDVAGLGDARGASDGTTDPFLAMLAATYGKHISGSVAREMELVPNERLAPEKISLALRMAADHVCVFEGFNFLSRLDVSAQSNGRAFRAVLGKSVLSGAELSSDARRAIDVRLDESFRHASSDNHRAVSQHDAESLLASVLMNIK